jgi:hypothetical protein
MMLLQEWLKLPETSFPDILTDCLHSITPADLFLRGFFICDKLYVEPKK